MILLPVFLLLATPALSLDPLTSSHDIRAQLELLPRDFMLATRAPNVRVAARQDTSGALLTPELADFIQATMDTFGIKGVSVAVVRRGDNGTFAVDTRGFGVRNSAGEPMTAKVSRLAFCGEEREVDGLAQTVIPIASNSKQFTAAAVGLLAENATAGFTLHTPLRDVLPQFGLMDHIADAHADAYDILAHRTGLPRHDLLILRDGIDADFSVRRMWPSSNSHR